jgi:hypothetical protein
MENHTVLPVGHRAVAQILLVDADQEFAGMSLSMTSQHRPHRNRRTRGHLTSHQDDGPDSVRKVLTFGHLVEDCYRACGSRRARGIIRLAAKARVLRFQPILPIGRSASPHSHFRRALHSAPVQQRRQTVL